MTNYICINGNKTELTEEQLKQLGIEIPKVNPFARVNKSNEYLFITSVGEVGYHRDINDHVDNACFNIANYCTDKAIMEQRALHETLNRLLWRYSMEHKENRDEHKIGGVCIKYTDTKWHVYHFGWSYNIPGIIYFDNERIAENAIEEVIKPFMAAHPDFKF